MKKQTNQLTIIIFCLFLISAIIPSLAVDREVSFNVQKGDVLEVNIKHGNIVTSTWDKNEVKIIAKNIDEDEIKLFTAEQKSGRVEVKFKGEDSDNFNLELTIPADLIIDYKTGGGNVTIKDDLRNKVTISTAGGNITAKIIGGEANITSAGGNIKLADINNNASISTAGGDIQVGSVNGKAEISTAGGNIKVGSVNNTAEISTAGGNVNVGTVGGSADISTAGGNVNVSTVSGDAEISTGGGNIKLDGATGKVEANTGGGNIELKNVKGSIEANTGAGNITAELIPDGANNSQLNSGVGSITIYIPESAKTTIVATASDFKWGESAKDSDSIKSEFESYNVSQIRKGNTFESIYKLNGGGSRIELNVGMGNINIKKLK
ncbi:MAG TPA: hypothetical protein VLH59_10720 [Ignavibacteriaceae bacterium]|nr:hypothetical protein [Ignavibacteriaceae bacterium]